MKYFAIAEAQRCDPNILGVISDTLMEVDKVDICIAYCMLNDGTKFSVRSCTEKTQVIDIAKFLAPNSGGGHARKAGGFLPVDSGKPDAVVRRFFYWIYMPGLEGDYLVAREDDPADMYIIKGDIFDLTYETARK